MLHIVQGDTVFSYVAAHGVWVVSSKYAGTVVTSDEWN